VVARSSYDYALIQLVPRVERAERINLGVVLYSLTRDFLATRTTLDEPRLRAFWPTIDLPLVTTHLAAFDRISLGDPTAGPIARLTQRERFHWLVAPRSTILQTSAVHSGLCDDPALTLTRLFERLVACPDSP